MEEITNTPATIDDAAANAPETPVDKGKLPRTWRATLMSSM
jgi:hypothetical protein